MWGKALGKMQAPGSSPEPLSSTFWEGDTERLLSQENEWGDIDGLSKGWGSVPEKPPGNADKELLGACSA